ncbi:MAG: hypothetical protein AAFO82_17055, partial [Bacteroidota bacterium]
MSVDRAPDFRIQKGNKTVDGTFSIILNGKTIDISDGFASRCSFEDSLEEGEIEVLTKKLYQKIFAGSLSQILKGITSISFKLHDSIIPESLCYIYLDSYILLM